MERGIDGDELAKGKFEGGIGRWLHKMDEVYDVWDFDAVCDRFLRILENIFGGLPRF